LGISWRASALAIHGLSERSGMLMFVLILKEIALVIMLSRAVGGVGGRRYESGTNRIQS
jgi:hypothetical protein